MPVTVTADCAAGLEVCGASRVKATTELREVGAGNFFEKAGMGRYVEKPR